MATLSFQRAIPGGNLGEGAALAMAMVPFLLAAILFSYFGLQRRAWQQGGATSDLAKHGHPEAEGRRISNGTQRGTGDPSLCSG